MAIRYGRAGGNWSAAGTWSATAGSGGTPGASDGSGLAASGDAVVLNGNSSGTFVIDVSSSILSLDCTGFAGALNFTFNGTCTVTGTLFTLSAGMTITFSSSARTFTFTGAAGSPVLITTFGKTISSMVFNGAGVTFQFQDTYNGTVAGNAGIVLTSGTLDLNNQSITVGAITASGSTARAITFGSASLQMNAVAVGPLDFGGTNLTVTKGTGSIVMASNALTNQQRQIVMTAVMGALPDITIGSFTGNSCVFFNGAGTMNSLTINAPNRARFSNGGTFIVSNALAVTGASASARTQIQSTSASSQVTISKASGTVTLDHCYLEDLFCTGGATFSATNSFNVGNSNSGISIFEPGAVVGGLPINESGAPMINYNIEYAQPSVSTNTIMTATGHKLAMVGQVWHPTKKSGTLNIRKVHFRTGATTLNAASEVRVSLQNISATAGPPYQPDGTQDQFYDFKSATTPITASAQNITGNLSADRVVDLSSSGVSLGSTNSQWLAVVFEFNVFTAADSLIVSCITNIGFRTGMGGNVMLNTGTWASVSQRVNSIVLECDDGTYAFMNPGWPCVTPNSTSISSTAAVRRGGLRFSVPTARVIDRMSVSMVISNGSDGRLVLYDGDGTTELASVDIDNDAVLVATGYFMEVVFPPVTLLAGVFYRFAFVGGTTTTSTMAHFDVANAGYLDGMLLGQNAHWTQHDGTSWTQTLTRVPIFGLGVSGMHGGTSSGGGGGVIGS